ncbi:MAG TPA: glycoside hydrolase family 9 protein [Puia sp.]|nr:glycoside hydrolase family 9 protein [Puia sp.]
MRILLVLSLLALCRLPCFSQPAIPPAAIAVNQLGFYPDAPKYAVIDRPAAKDVFFIVTVGASTTSWSEHVDTVFFGRLGPVLSSANSSLSTRIADFSGLHRPGIYRVVIPGFQNSYPFAIGSGVFSPLTAAALKGYYYQRSAMALTATYADKWARPAGHPDVQVLVHASAADAGRPEGTVIPATGGWYDAGDYNKYIVNSGITMGTLLDAYEDFSGYFDTLHTNIPPAAGVTQGTIPDVLNEALYNLRWMLLMQDPADGGVYHKCTNAAFDGMVMPGVTRAPRYVVQKGTAATLDFAAVTAQAARIFRRFATQLPGLADSCERAAVHAWQWARNYPDSVYDQEVLNRRYKPAITTGAYGDRFFNDERFWAASELLVTTGDASYAATVHDYYGISVSLPSWAYVAMMGDYSLLRHAAAIPAGLRPMLDSVRQGLLIMADNYVRKLAGTAFHTVIGESKSDFVWGSNSVAGNEGMLLVNAWLQKHDPAYLDAALTNLYYILGQNATGYCFVTGFGTHSPMHPHHRPSVADGVVAPVPGLLVGGANPGRQDQQTYAYTEAETAYLDNDQAYASNEIAINWNAPLVYLAGAMEALQYTTGYAQPGQTAPPAQAAPSPQALAPMSHPLTKDRSGLYVSNFPIGGEFSEQVALNTDGTFEYLHADARGQVRDTVGGTYQIVEDKLYLTYTSANAKGPKLLLMHGKRLYQTDARGLRVKKAPGVSGRRQYLLFGSRKRKYYLELQTT